MPRIKAWRISTCLENCGQAGSGLHGQSEVRGLAVINEQDPLKVPWKHASRFAAADSAPIKSEAELAK